MSDTALALLFVEDEYCKQRGVGRISVLRAAILELMCDTCDSQERWRGRSTESVEKVARMKGWQFDERRALCPKHVRFQPIPTSKGIRRKNVPGICSYDNCDSPIMKSDVTERGGRPTNKCEKHYWMCRHWSDSKLRRDVATPQPKNPYEGGSRGPEKPDVPLGEPQKNPDPGIEDHPHKARPLPPRRPNNDAA